MEPKKKYATVEAAKITRANAVIVALLGFLGVSLAALFGYMSIRFQVEKPIIATQTAEAKPTTPILASFTTISPSLTASPTTTPLLPTSTATSTTTYTPIPTETPLPTPTPTPEIIFKETFLNNSKGWLNLTSEPYGVKLEAKIVGGKYVHVVECPLSYEAYYCCEYYVVPHFSGDNFRLDFDVTVEKVTADTDVMVGVQFRRNSGDYYVAYFRSSGIYKVQMAYNGKIETFKEDEMGQFYNRQVGSTNTFGIVADDALLSVYVNEQKLTTVEDGNISLPGEVYFAVYVSKGGKATISFDNLVISKVR